VKTKINEIRKFLHSATYSNYLDKQNVYTTTKNSSYLHSINSSRLDLGSDGQIPIVNRCKS